MLSNERVKEAEVNVRSYLEDGLLKKTSTEKQVMNIFIQNGKESLRAAETIQQQKISDLWVIVCSYYAMYYYTNANKMK